MDFHRQFYNGSLRPDWAGSVRSVSRQRLTGPDRLADSVELSGLVLPVSVLSQYLPAVGNKHTAGLGIGFPQLGEFLPGMHPDLWKNWGRLEQVLTEAAIDIMGWKGSQGPREANRSGLPENAIHLRMSRQVLRSAGQDGGDLLRPDAVFGDISKVFAIRDVSGSQVRFESAGSAATFKLTPSSADWSRDPRTL